MKQKGSEVNPWKTLLMLAQPLRGRAMIVILLAALSTGASLVEPLIYRIVVNDIAGLFVGKAQSEAALNDEEEAFSTGAPQQTVEAPSPQPHRTPVEPHRRASAHERQRQFRARTTEPHRPGHVAPRTPSQTLRTFIWAVGLMFGLSVFSYFVWLIADNMSATIASQIETGFIQRVFGHVLRLPLQFFGKRSSGAIAKQIDQADQVSPIVNAVTQTLLPEMMTIVGALAIMVTQNWEMTLIALVTVPAYLFVAWRSAKRLEKGLEDYYAQWEDVSGRIQDAVSAIKTVRLSGAENREIERFKMASALAYDSYLNRTRLENRFSFWQHTITQVGQALVLGLGGWFALRRELTPGDVVMFVSYVGMLYDPVDSLTKLAIEIQQYGIALRRALRLTQTEPETSGGQPVKSGPGKIELQNVDFSYVPEHHVLRKLSLSIEAGQVVALVGPSGAGKTTIVDLLMRLYQPNAGKILLDGQSLSTLDAAALRRDIGVVAADGAIFRGTLAANIRYKRPEASDAEVHEAALAAGLAHTLERLPDGLETNVGEGGMGLSVGERQRLQLARMLASAPRVIVLDEATANLDYSTEQQVKEAFAKLRQGRTTIIIAHRYSMVKDVDYVYVLEDGQVVEAGTPEELRTADGWFAAFAGDDGDVDGEEEMVDDEDESEAEDEDFEVEEI